MTDSPYDDPVERTIHAGTKLHVSSLEATPGPWYEPNGNRYSAIISDQAGRHTWPYEDAYKGYLVGESITATDRHYLALVHPLVGRALGDYLIRVGADAIRTGHPLLNNVYLGTLVERIHGVRP